jgi:hypothetical protein
MSGRATRRKVMAALLLAGAAAGCAPGAELAQGPAERTRLERALASGDGRSTETPIEIGRLADAYLVIRARGWTFVRQAVVREREQYFDVFTVRDRMGLERRVVFSLVAETAGELRVARAVRRVMTSGDGRGYATAFAAPSVPVEDDVLRLLGLEREQQATVSRDGTAFDVVSAVSVADGTRREVYFRRAGGGAGGGAERVAGRM